MQVEITHHVDASARNADGSYEYYYEYDLFRFSDGADAIVARCDVDEPDEAHFLSKETHGERSMLCDQDIRSAFFAEAVSHLRKLGKSKFRWLSGRGDGYEPL
jgi:hypothetical protein